MAKSDHPKIPVVYASSAAVYGDCDRLPLREAEHVMPISAYGADKLACEQHARVAARIFGLHTVGLRFFNVFGPRQDPTSPYSGVISIFARRCLAGEPMRIFGDGGQSRDFIHVSDIVAALCAAPSRALFARVVASPGPSGPASPSPSTTGRPAPSARTRTARRPAPT